MSGAVENHNSQRSIFAEPFALRSLAALAALAAFVVALALIDRPRAALAVAGAPLIALILTAPRAALMQFIFVLFIGLPLGLSYPLALIEVSGALVIGAAVIDSLCRPGIRQTTPLLVPMAVLLGAILLSAFFAFDTSRAFLHPLKFSFLILVFLSCLRLMRHLTIHSALKVFIALAAIHGLNATYQAIASSGLRSFGMAHKALDDILMLAAPAAFACFLLGEKRGSFWRLLALAGICAGLLATQSRIPILFGAVGCALVWFFARRDARVLSNATDTINSSIRRMRRRSLLIFSGLGVALVAAVIGGGGALVGVGERFAELFDARAGGTLLLRLTLWRAALEAFLQNPILGLGPSNFQIYDSISSAFRFSPTVLWVRGLSAHSLTLHYLAETGIIGATAALSIFVRQLIIAHRARVFVLQAGSFDAPSLALFVVAIILLLSAVFEAAWTWGHVSYTAIFFLALIATQYRRVLRTQTLGA